MRLACSTELGSATMDDDSRTILLIVAESPIAMH